jgi:iron complex outermembrane recepter protein
MSASPLWTTITTSLATGGGILMRSSIVSAAICLSLIGLSTASEVEAAMRRSTHIPAQGLGPALQVLAKDHDVQVLYRTEVVGELRTGGAVGELTATEALTQLLSGTGLTYRYLDDRTVTIVPLSSSASDPVGDAAAPPATSMNSESSAPAADAHDNGALEEIIVTATKREERLMDVPLSIQAVTGQQLEKTGAVNFADYARTIAGVSFFDGGPGRAQIFMRGVSTGSDVDTGKESTVGVYIDETPVTEGSAQPDLKLYDIDRVEVLRGPQGTLYGSGSLGGTVRILTNQPDPSGYDGRIEASGSMTGQGGTNGAVNGMINVPVSGAIALRVVGYGIGNAGFLDNGYSGAKDINDEKTWGGRAALRFLASDRLDITVSGAHQRSDIGAYYQVTDHYPSLVIDESAPEPFDDHFSIGNLKLQYDAGFATLTSSTSYFDRRRHFGNDIDWFAEANYGIPRVDSPLTYDISALSEEIRLASSGEDRLNWIVGAFYVDRDDDFLQTVNVRGAPVPSDPVDFFYYSKTHSSTRQLAGFGELNYDIASNLTATVGLRVSQIDRALQSVKNGAALGGVASSADGDSNERPVTPKVNLSYKPTRDALIYIQAAKGFRVGGVNPGLPPCEPAAGCEVDVGATFGSDSLWNYELGTKLQMLDGALALTAAAFYIEWTDIQLNVDRKDGFNGFDNVGDAVSKGVELEATARLDTHVQLGGQVTYTNTELTRLDQGILGVGAAGDRLPDVPQWSSAAFLEWGTSFGSAGRFYARGDVQYVGERNSKLQSNPNNFALDAYTLANLRLGVNIGPYGASLFVNNLTDKRAQLGREILDGVRDGVPISHDRYTINRPRTFGLSLSREF